MLGPIGGFVLTPLALLGAACALLSLVLASVELNALRDPRPKAATLDVI